MLPKEYVKEVRKIDEENKVSNISHNDHIGNHSNPRFLATTRRIMHFSNNREPKPTDKIVYIQGSFDLLHDGHIDTLKRARQLGDFLYVGVWGDDVVN